jgi:hypothetical protein
MQTEFTMETRVEILYMNYDRENGIIKTQDFLSVIMAVEYESVKTAT